MKISSLKLFTEDAFKSMYRNFTLSIASVATVTFTLFLFGTFLLAFLNVNQGATNLQSKLEVKVFLKKDVTSAQKKDIEAELKVLEQIKSYDYMSKADALNNAKEMFGNDEQMIKQFETVNPFPESYTVQIKSEGDISKITDKISPLSGVEDVNIGKDTIRTFQKVLNSIKYIGVILLIILAGVSIFLIGNTTKLAVYSRRKEISIMKTIGATDWFIRFPFIIEGVVIGIIGSALAISLVYFMYKFVIDYFAIATLNMSYIKPEVVSSIMSWQFLLLGIFLGATGSMITIRKFLKV